MAVSRGLFCLRYVGADDPASPPLVSVHAAPGFDDDIRVFCGPDLPTRLMRHPGDVLVISASRRATLVVTIFVSSEAAADNVKLKLERLDRSQGEDEAVSETAQPATETVPDSILPVAMGGHIERVGDVSVAPGAWLGSRRGSRSIEGFALTWEGRPTDVDVLYGCVVAELGRMPEALTGGFVGTRGRGLPMTGVSARLVGDQAAEYELKVEAAFADGSVIGPSAGVVDLATAEGTEPIVGLRFLVKKRERSDSVRDDDKPTARDRTGPSIGKYAYAPVRPGLEAAAE